MDTAQEYREKTLALIVGEENYKYSTPAGVRRRVEHLLKVESRAREICKKKLFRKLGVSCPYCGWTHD